MKNDTLKVNLNPAGRRPKTPLSKPAALLAAIVLAFFSVHCPTGGYKEPEQKLHEGDTAPPFTLPDKGGATYTLQDLYGEKPLLLVFFSAHCPPCRMELKTLNGLKNFNSDRGNALKFNVVMVTNASPGEIMELERRDGPIKYTVLYDADQAVLRTYGVFAFPHNFLIDTDGRIIMVELGYSDRIVNDINRKIGTPGPPPGEDRELND